MLTVATSETTLLPEQNTLSRCSATARVFNLAIPMALSYTFSLEMWLMVLFLSRLNSDKENQAAITLTTTLINAFVIIGISPLFAMSMVAGKKIGELKNAMDNAENELDQQLRINSIARVNHHGLMIASLTLPLVTLPLIFSAPILTKVFGQNPIVAADTQAITRPYGLLAFPGIMLRLCSEQLMFSFGRTKPAMIMGLCNAAIGMGIAYTLAFGKFDAPNLNEKGMLIGYIIEAYLTALAFSLYIALHPSFKAYPFFRPQKPILHLSEMKEILNIGCPILIGNAIEMGSVVATGALAGRVSVDAQAAYSTNMQFILFTFLLQSAFGQSSCQEMSRLIGDKAYKNAATIGRYGILSTLACISPALLLFSIKPEFLMNLLGHDSQESLSILKTLVPMMSACVVVDATRYCILKQLQNNLEDGKLATLIASAGLLSGVFFSWGLGLHTNLGIYGVALGYLIGLVMTTSILFFRWNSRIKSESIEALQINRIERNRFFSEVHLGSNEPLRNQYTTLTSSLNVV